MRRGTKRLRANMCDATQFYVRHSMNESCHTREYVPLRHGTGQMHTNVMINLVPHSRVL